MVKAIWLCFDLHSAPTPAPHHPILRTLLWERSHVQEASVSSQEVLTETVTDIFKTASTVKAGRSRAQKTQRGCSEENRFWSEYECWLAEINIREGHPVTESYVKK